MSERFSIHRTDEEGVIARSADGQAVCSLSIKEWETDFFGARFGSLRLESHVVDQAAGSEYLEALDKVLGFADREGYHLIEAMADIRDLEHFPYLEDRGFRIVDTRVTFLTRLAKKDLPPPQVEAGELGFARPDDLGPILRLTHDSFVENPAFFSRFKNRDYFTEEQSAAYFRAWIINNFENEDTLFAVFRESDKLGGYFFYKRQGLHEDRPLYKGMLAAIAPEFRGRHLHLRMQEFLYHQFDGDEFFIDNTTQLTNVPILKNHMTSKKELKEIRVVFFRRHPVRLPQDKVVG
jgi:hypothetical protein